MKIEPGKNMKGNEIPNNQNEGEPLPEMETYEQAEAVAQERGDQFYVCAFMIKDWILRRFMEAAVRLSPKVREPEGSLQSGKAWKGFLDIFGRLQDRQFHYSVEALSRFIRYDDPWPGLLSRARTALLLEWDRLGKDAQLRSLLAAKNPAQAVPLLRRCAERWCDWLDATVHLEIFAHYQFSQELPGEEDIDTPFATFGYPLCQSPAAAGATEGA